MSASGGPHLNRPTANRPQAEAVRWEPSWCRHDQVQGRTRDFGPVVWHDIDVREDSTVPGRNTMITAIRKWGDARNRDRAPRKLITDRRPDDGWDGFVPIGRYWFYYQARTLQTGEGPRLVICFFLVVKGNEAQAFREASHLERGPLVGPPETRR